MAEILLHLACYIVTPEEMHGVLNPDSLQVWLCKESHTEHTIECATHHAIASAELLPEKDINLVANSTTPCVTSSYTGIAMWQDFNQWESKSRWTSVDVIILWYYFHFKTEAILLINAVVIVRGRVKCMLSSTLFSMSVKGRGANLFYSRFPPKSQSQPQDRENAYKQLLLLSSPLQTTCPCKLEIWRFSYCMKAEDGKTLKPAMKKD